MPNISRPLANEAGWNWDTQPSAVYSAAGQSTYCAWIDSGGSLWVGRYRHDYRTWEQQLLNAGAALSEIDDHDQPAILVRADGKLLVLWSYHNGSQYSQVSTNSYDISAWGAVNTVYDGSTNAAAYVKPIQTSTGLVWNFLRKCDSGVGNPRPQNYTVSSDGGVTWSAPVRFFTNTGNTQRPYVLLAQSGDRIDFALTDGQPNETTNSIYHCYMVVDSGGTFYTLFNSDATAIGAYNLDGSAHSGSPPALPLAPANVTKVWDGATANSWQYDLQWISGTLYLGFVTYSQTSVALDTHTYRLGTLSGGAWTTEVLADGGPHVPNWLEPDSYTVDSTYSGHLALDPNTPLRAYLGRRYAAHVGPPNPLPTGTLTAGSTTVSSVSSTTGMAVGQLVTHVPNTGPRLIPPGTTIASVGVGTITLSNPAVATNASSKLWFFGGDMRLEQWDKSGGSWGKTADLNGASGNGLANYRPLAVKGGLSPSAFFFLSGGYHDYTGGPSNTGTGWIAQLYGYGLPDPATTKAPTPTWTAAAGPTGTTNHYLIYEGSGATVHDLAGAQDGTIAGSPTWGTGTYGPELSGFSTANYVGCNGAAAAWGTASYPRWIAVLAKNSTTGTGAGYAISLGNSASNFDLAGIFYDTTAGSVNVIHRDHLNAGASITYTCGAATDGRYHVVALLALSATDFRLFLDGYQVATGSKTTGTYTFDHATIGALLRSGTTASTAFPGTVAAVVLGSGSTVGMAPGLMRSLSWDLLNGQFAGTRAAASSATYTLTPTAASVLVTDRSVGLAYGRSIAPDAASIAITPESVGFSRTYAIRPGPLPIRITGQSVRLAYSGRKPRKIRWFPGLTERR